MPNILNFFLDHFTTIVFSTLLIAPHIAGYVLLGKQKSIRLIHKQKKLVTHGYYGYCLYAYFLGGLVFIKRGRILDGLFCCLFWLLTWSLLGYVLAWYCNKIHLTGLIEQGWDLADEPQINAAALKYINYSTLEIDPGTTVAQ